MITRKLPSFLISIFMVLFALSAFLGAKIAYDPFLSQTALVSIVISALSYFVVAYLFRTHNVHIFLIVFAALFVTLFAVLFISQFGYQNYPETPNLIQRIGQITTFLPHLTDFYIHPNAASTLIETILPISAALAVFSRRWMYRGFWVVCTLIQLYAIGLTYSRGSWLALVLVVGISLYLWFALHVMPHRRLLVTIVALLVFALLSIVLISVSVQSSFLANTLGTAESRLTLYRNSLYLIGDYAFTGIGLGETFAMIYSRFSLLIFVPYLTYSHNLILAVWMGQGLLGLISFVGILVSFYLLVYRTIRWRGTVVCVLFYGAWLGATAAFLHGITDARQYAETPWVLVPLFFVIGSSVAFNSDVDVNLPMVTSKTTRRWPILMKSGFVFASLMIVLGIGLLMQQTISALWEVNQGAIYETYSDSVIQPNIDDQQRSQMREVAKEHYQKALEFDPELASANRRLGNLLVGQGNFEEAVFYLEKAVNGEPDNPAALKGLGLSYMWLGRTDEAARILEKLVDLPPIQDELYAWSQFYWEQKQPLLSAYSIETALLIDQLNANPNLDVWLLAGNRFEEGGDMLRARYWYERILDLDPNYLDAQNALNTISQ